MSELQSFLYRLSASYYVTSFSVRYKRYQLSEHRALYNETDKQRWQSDVGKVANQIPVIRSKSDSFSLHALVMVV